MIPDKKGNRKENPNTNVPERDEGGEGQIKSLYVNFLKGRFRRAGEGKTRVGRHNTFCQTRGKRNQRTRRACQLTRKSLLEGKSPLDKASPGGCIRRERGQTRGWQGHASLSDLGAAKGTRKAEGSQKNKQYKESARFRAIEES